MIAFRRIPIGSSGSAYRPLLDVYLDVTPPIPQTCLIDTGAGGIRLSAALGRAAGIALPDDPTGPDVIAGAVRSQVFSLSHRLTLQLDDGVVSWDAIVSFCDPWPHPFGLLGHSGFLDVFDVLMQARYRRFTLTARA